MYTLIRKDLRYYRVPIVSLIALMFIVYVIAPMLFASAFDTEKHTWILRATDYAVNLAIIGFWLTPVFFALVAAIAFSMERRERWIELQAMLPVSKWVITFSKLFVAVVICVAVLIAAIAVLLFTFKLRFMVWPERNPSETSWIQSLQAYWPNFLESASVFGAIAISLFGLSWLTSSILKSPTFSFAVPFALVVLVCFWMLALPNGTYEDREAIRVLFLQLAWISGFVGLIAGSVIQSIRISP